MFVVAVVTVVTVADVILVVVVVVVVVFDTYIYYTCGSFKVYLSGPLLVLVFDLKSRCLGKVKK